jgi:predicted PurR-regulated permease PerM
VAIAIVYLGIVFVPIIIALILVPPAVEQGVNLANKLPGYARDLNQAFDENPQLKEANEKYEITTKLESVAEKLVSNLGDAAGALVDIGAGVVSSVFALVTILVISMLMMGRGKAWRDAALRYRPPDQAAASGSQGRDRRRGRLLHRRGPGAGHRRRRGRVDHVGDSR